MNPETLEYIHLLTITEQLRKELIERAITELSVPAGSHVLDTGCGIGLHLRGLLHAAAPKGRVTGLDISQDFLNYAANLVITGPESKSITLKQGSINHLPFDDQQFDIAWSVDCAGYMPDSNGKQLSEMYRVIKPGGQIALMFWAGQTLLPGYPELEAKLNSTTAGIAPFNKSLQPQDHSLRLPARLRATGFQQISMHTFTGHVMAPLSAELRTALLALFRMRWGHHDSGIPADLRGEYQKLCDSNSPECILNIPDYTAFYTYVMFTAVKKINKVLN